MVQRLKELEEEKKLPTLEQFDAEIQKYKTIQEEVSTLPSNHSIMWLKVDAKPLKSNISNFVSKWTYKYTEFLQNDVTTKVDDLLTFVKSACPVSTCFSCFFERSGPTSSEACEIGRAHV